MASKERPDYGIDAPGVVRNLGVVGVASLLVATASLLHLIPRVVGWHGTSGGGVQLAIVPSTLSAGVALCATACWMFFGSKYGKTSERDKLIGRIEWKGDERVLDVGCGRGLILVGAALKLKTGSAVGVDIWQAADLSGNRDDVPLENAALEGVAERVTVQTADMRRMPFPDNSFDVVLSRAAIHNLYSSTDRETAIREIARVLRPGGCAVIADIRHHREYMKTFKDAGCQDVRLLDSRMMSMLCALFTMGSLRPNTLLAVKAV
ncbi:MAG: class I SAM-dependent methyltransferase [Acidobacteria bacterium]|nr:class I SAM-dependent methyltransferase [Acidobacteriota bacterium]MBI3657564.1 class I SAM-dependent methyltransferase [Acidobacteriota bacterium]